LKHLADGVRLTLIAVGIPAPAPASLNTHGGAVIAVDSGGDEADSVYVAWKSLPSAGPLQVLISD